MRVLAGTPLHVLNPALQALGLALPNLGDIDRQTISGAIATGTHGTGTRRQGIAAAVSGLTLVLADGSTLECSAEVEPEVFAAARVGLGALGVVTEVELQCVPAFRLHAKEAAASLTELLPVIQDRGRRAPTTSTCSGSRTPTGCSPSATTSSGRARARRPLPAWRSRRRGRPARQPARSRASTGWRPRGPRWCRRSTGSAPGRSAPGSSPTTRGRCSAPRATCASSRASTPCRGTASRRCSPSCAPGSPAPTRRSPFPVEVRFIAADDVVAVDGLRARQRLRRGAPVPPDGPAAAVRRLRGDRRRARGPPALGQGAHPGRASGCASSTPASTTSARCASGSTRATCSPTTTSRTSSTGEGHRARDHHPGRALPTGRAAEPGRGRVDPASAARHQRHRRRPSRLGPQQALGVLGSDHADPPGGGHRVVARLRRGARDLGARPARAARRSVPTSSIRSRGG